MNSTRKSGLILFATSVASTAALIAMGQRMHDEGRQFAGFLWAMPGALTLVGLVQLVSGVPFTELSSRRNSLEGWQRGVLGTLIFLGACGLIFLGILVFVTVAYD
jgi:hypothetical protein